jgi:hypothetical protein
MNRALFDVVVHICPQAVWEVLHLDAPKGANPVRLRQLIDEGRIVGLDHWLSQLS